MKKSFIMCGVVLSLCANAYAFENVACGFSVKEGNPMLLVETSDTFAYSNYSVKSYNSVFNDNKMETYTAIRSVDKKTMSEALGTVFSTHLFNKELEKLAQNKGKSDLKKLSKFAQQGIYANVDKDLLKYLYDDSVKKYIDTVEANANVTVVKIGKGKALEFSNYFTNEGNIFALKTTVLSDNDRIYTLSTIAPDISAGNVISNKISKFSEIEGNKDQFMVLEEKDLELDKVKKLKNDHTKTLKSFKTFAPTSNKHIFGYTDSINKNLVKLPQDWFYVKANLLEAAGNGQISFAASSEEIKQAIKSIVDYRTQKVGKNTDFTDKEYEECLNLVLKNINQAKAALAFTMADDQLKDMFGEPLKTKIIADQILKEGFRRAKEFSVPYFKLVDYNYNTWFNENTGKVDIDVLATLCKAYTYEGKLKGQFSAIANTAGFTLDINKIINVGKKIQNVKNEPANMTNKNQKFQ